ncbi:Mitogen-activated protein kinase kinase kinase MLT, partial [Tetrabaena socialis]
MLASSPPGSPGGGPEEGGSMHDSAESTIHSYEVRLVLEFCDKGSLKDALDQQAFLQGGALNLCAMLETAADVAKAMVHMHAANVLHSDLKARNIMLKSSGTEGRGIIAKVADFGLSTRMEHQETHLSSCFQGTLTHMAPEVMMEGRISKAADVYSFGIVMWELFCASDPFAGVPRAHLGHAITKEGRRPKFPPFAPRSFVSLATRCWDPDASLRPTFAEVLTELLRVREELGGDTPALLIVPPQPLTPQASGSLRGGAGAGAGGSRARAGSSEGAGALGQLGGGGGGGGSGTMLGSGIVLMGAGSTADGSAMGSMAHSAMAHRAVLKSSLVQRQMRKMGLRLGGGGSSSG